MSHGQIALPASQGKSSFIDVRDIAASAVSALTSSAFDGKSFNLTGPQGLSYTEAADVLSKAVGKTIRYSAISDEAFISILTDAGVALDYATFMASIFYPVREGWTAAATDNVQTLTGVAPCSLETYAAEYAALLKAS